jgi:hypothetical protein
MVVCCLRRPGLLLAFRCLIDAMHHLYHQKVSESSASTRIFKEGSLK